MPIPPELLLAAASLLAAVAAGVVWLWLRRRTTPSDHPHCRKCRFDLFGLPATSDRCPECGAPIGHPRATVDLRILARRRRRMIAILAVLLIATSIGSAWRFIHNPQHTALQPNLVLLYLMERDAHARRAESALVQRLKNNQLGSASRAIIRARAESWLDRAPQDKYLPKVQNTIVSTAIWQGIIAGTPRYVLLERLVELTGRAHYRPEYRQGIVTITLPYDGLPWDAPTELKIINVGVDGKRAGYKTSPFQEWSNRSLWASFEGPDATPMTVTIECEVIFTITPPGREPEIVTIMRSVDVNIASGPAVVE